MNEAKIYLKTMILLLFLAVGCVTINIAKDIYDWHEWNETKTVFIVTVKDGDTLYNYGYQYKPDWMDIRDYDVDKNIKGYVIYEDIPYKDTTKYATEQFPYEEFYDWCRMMSQNNIVLISEYNMPDDFECIWSKDLICSLDKNSRTNKVEKLWKWRG